MYNVIEHNNNTYTTILYCTIGNTTTTTTTSTTTTGVITAQLSGVSDPIITTAKVFVNTTLQYNTDVDVYASLVLQLRLYNQTDVTISNFEVSLGLLGLLYYTIL